MAQIPPEVYNEANSEDNESGCDNDVVNKTSMAYHDEGHDTDDAPRCVKLGLDENIAAYKEKKELIRDWEVIPCSSNLVENVTMNYIIAKQIISNLPWQEKLICKQVCSTWYSAVQVLAKEQISPEDFIINYQLMKPLKDRTTFLQSGVFYSEPLVIMTFVNSTGLALCYECNTIKPSPCKNPCKKEHSLMDLVNYKANAPKNCLHAIKANYLSYVPLPNSKTYEHTILYLKNKPFIGGIYIPAIPGVEYHTIHIKSNSVSIKEEFFDIVAKIAKDKIIKGVLVYATERYLLHTVEDIVFLNYFRDVQPEIPYALGGCIIEDTTMLDENDVDLLVGGINSGIDFTSDNLISIGLFSIPKNPENMECNFDMFSLVLESSDWCKTRIQQSINEFANQVPKFEHSVALKLSCVGRDQKHKLEQELFRAIFPSTRIIGCYGNGELGLNHPARVTPDPVPNAAKRHRRDPGPQHGIMFSYSTVFVYMGWGKILSDPRRK